VVRLVTVRIAVTRTAVTGIAVTGIAAGIAVVAGIVVGGGSAPAVALVAGAIGPEPV
jgi:hypothetical protein